IIIAFSNKSVQLYNTAVRDELFPGSKSIEKGDLFLVVRNNYTYSLLNGEFGKIIDIRSDSEKRNVTLRDKDGKVINKNLYFRDVVIEVTDENDVSVQIECKIIENILDSKHPQLSSNKQRALYVLFKNDNPGLKPGTPLFKKAIEADPYFNALHIKYGYCITCHKAQGGEWDRVIIDFKTGNNPYNVSYFRWCYTAITRCKKHLYALNPPQYRPLGGAQFVETNKLMEKDSMIVINDEIDDEKYKGFEFHND
ncbi:uncharacterized protein METZ01_LOCUS457246, partial [marine metagenome]